MISWIIVFLGGGMGSICRYYLAKNFNNSGQEYTIFPIGTFFANILSCFILGILIQKQISGNLHENYRLLLITGFCGGFSTFSTFGYEIYLYIERGQIMFGVGYILFSLIAGILVLYAGIKLGGLT